MSRWSGPFAHGKSNVDSQYCLNQAWGFGLTSQALEARCLPESRQFRAKGLYHYLMSHTSGNS